MKTLVIDTCFNACSVAVIGAGPVVDRYEEMQRGHAEALMPMLKTVMSEAGVIFKDLGQIAVTTGPGTFTGMRIGVAAARALALAADLPVLGVSSLLLAAWRARRELGAAYQSHAIAVAIDARKEQIYLQLVDATDRAITAPVVLAPANAVHLLPPGPLIAVGNGAKALREAVMLSRIAKLANGQSAAAPASGTSALNLEQIATALSGLVPAAADFKPTYKANDPGDQNAVKPLYLRPADAKPQIGKSLARA